MIALCRVGRIELLHALFGQLVLPEAVWQEVIASYPEKTGASIIAAASWVEHRCVQDVQLVNLLRQDLGAGESEAIVLAREVKADVLLMDERRGRNAAKRLGLTCTGLPVPCRRLGVLEFFFAPPVAMLLDQAAGFGESKVAVSLRETSRVRGPGE